MPGTFSPHRLIKREYCQVTYHYASMPIFSGSKVSLVSLVISSLNFDRNCKNTTTVVLILVFLRSSSLDDRSKTRMLLSIMQKKTVFLDLCRNNTIQQPCIAGFLCRAIFRGCAEVGIFGDIFTSATPNFQFPWV